MPDVPDQSQLRNRLLATLPGRDFSLLRPHLERRSLDLGFPAELAHQPLRSVFFPEPGVLSVVVQTSTGMRLEAGIIGAEGMTGTCLLHGTDRSPGDVLVQIPCRAWQIDADALRGALGASRPLHDTLLLYAQAFAVQVMYTALANGRFTIGERLARWMLMCHDRVDREDIALTHQSLSTMLGVRRAGITTALQVLESSGAIRARRGVITIVGRDILLDAAGDAYGVPEAEYRRLFAQP